MSRTRTTPWFSILCMLVSTVVCADAGPMKLWYEKPASKWVEALPLGNGHFGAMVFGGTDTLVLNGQVENGQTRFQARLVVRTSGGITVARGDQLKITDADAATLILVAATSFVNYRDINGDPDSQNRQTLERIGNKSYATMRHAHTKDDQELFRRVSLDFGETDQVQLPTDQRLKPFGPRDPQLAALFFQYGRYLLIASSRPGSQPANLQGIWNESKTPPWESKWTINNANHGIWVTGGAWLCQHLWWHYLYNGDEEFLAQTAYPLMRGASLFFVDYLMEDPNTTHRHVSHLWGLHPGNEIHPRTTPELAEACRVTLRLRGDGGTGWSIRPSFPR